MLVYAFPQDGKKPAWMPYVLSEQTVIFWMAVHCFSAAGLRAALRLFALMIVWMRAVWLPVFVTVLVEQAVGFWIELVGIQLVWKLSVCDGWSGQETEHDIPCAVPYSMNEVPPAPADCWLYPITVPI